MMLKSLKQIRWVVGSNLANGLFHFNGSPSHLVLFVLHMGWGWAKGMGSNHHPFCFFCLEFHFPFLFFFFFFGLSWIRKEAMEIFNNFFTTITKSSKKKHLET